MPTEPEDKIDKTKMTRAIAPNFVHALDAAHMLRTVEQVLDTVGPSVHLTMIHDSYGTHACDAGRLAEALRQAFVQMYQEANWLEKFRDEIAEQIGEAATCIPPMPEAGKLVLSDVIRSQYFFA
jgi:DNA-directed RNA polymerase